MQASRARARPDGSRLEHGDVAEVVARDAEGVDVALGGCLLGGLLGLLSLLGRLLGGAGDGGDGACGDEDTQVDEPRGRVELCRMLDDRDREVRE